MRLLATIIWHKVTTKHKKLKQLSTISLSLSAKFSLCHWLTARVHVKNVASLQEPRRVVNLHRPSAIEIPLDNPNRVIKHSVLVQ